MTWRGSGLYRGYEIMTYIQAFRVQNLCSSAQLLFQHDQVTCQDLQSRYS